MCGKYTSWCVALVVQRSGFRPVHCFMFLTLNSAVIPIFIFPSPQGPFVKPLKPSLEPVDGKYFTTGDWQRGLDRERYRCRPSLQ